MLATSADCGGALGQKGILQMLVLVELILGRAVRGSVGGVSEQWSGLAQVVGAFSLFNLILVLLCQWGAGGWAPAISLLPLPPVPPNLCLLPELGLAPPAARILDNCFVQNTTGHAMPFLSLRCAPRPPWACASLTLVPCQSLHPVSRSVVLVSVLLLTVLVTPLAHLTSC